MGTIVDITLFVGWFVIVMSMPCVHAITVTWGITIPWLEEGHYLILSLAGITHYIAWISLARISTTKVIEKTLGADVIIKRRRWHSPFIISTLHGGSIINTSGIN